jgi:asparagine N-glycosylation enzyme membrane subunit Stt3
MEAVDSKFEPIAPRSHFFVSTFLKIEVAVIFMFFGGKDVPEDFYLAAALAAVCAVVNQVTEMLYLRKTTQRKRLLLLFESLLVIVLLFLVAYLSLAFWKDLSFTYIRKGETRIDTFRIWALAKLLGFTFAILASERLVAILADTFLSSRYGKSLNTSLLPRESKLP